MKGKVRQVVVNPSHPDIAGLSDKAFRLYSIMLDDELYGRPPIEKLGLEERWRLWSAMPELVTAGLVADSISSSGAGWAVVPRGDCLRRLMQWDNGEFELVGDES